MKWVQFSFKQRPILSAAPEELKIMQALGALIRENTEIETFSKQKKNIKKEGYVHVEQSLLIQNSDKFDLIFYHSHIHRQLGELHFALS